MFSSFTSRLHSEVETIKTVLDTHDRLRSLLFSPEFDPIVSEQVREEGGVLVPQDQVRESLRQARVTGPSKPAWHIYDHCAAFTRLYAIYEQFVEGLVSDYLRMLPELYQQYQDLPEKVATQHRVGTGQILLKLGKDGPYKALEERDIIKNLAHGLSGNPDYTLLRDAFLIDPQNYRAEVLSKLFTYLGIENCWAWIEKHPLVTDFMQRERDANETPKTLLRDFVENRNLASHTIVGETLATEEIKSIADFVVVLSEALAQLVMKQVVQRKKLLGEIAVAGQVMHKYSGNVVGARMSAGALAVGDELVVVQKHACYKAAVISIQIQQGPLERLETQDGQEIGIKLSVTAAVQCRGP